jgi:polar amino acid transport system substrate-binding protein
VSPHSRTLSALLKPLRNWAPVLILSVVVVVSATIVAAGLRTSPVSPSRPVLVSSGAWAPFVGLELPDGGPVTKLVVHVFNGSGYSPEINSTSWSFAVKFNSASEGFRALADGSIDVLAEGLLSGQAVLNDPSFVGDAGDFAYLQDGDPLVHSMEGLYFMMTDTNEAATVMKQFNKVLAEMRQSLEYEEIVAELEPAAFQEVTLTPAGNTGLVEVLDADGKLMLAAPQGTRAHVLTGPREFVGSAGAPPEHILVEVKVTNGPAQGRVLYMDARSLLLEAGTL